MSEYSREYLLQVIPDEVIEVIRSDRILSEMKQGVD